MKNIIYGVLVIIAFTSTTYHQNQLTELDNVEHWENNGNGTLTREGDVYTIQQSSEKPFFLRAVEDIDFSKEFILSFDLKVIEGDGFYISLNGDKDLKDDVRVEISDGQISINRWSKNSTYSSKLLKKKVSSKIDSKVGVHINIKQTKYNLYISIRSNVPETYDYKSFSISSRMQPDKYTIGIGLSGTSLCKAEVSYFCFGRPIEW